MAMSKGNKGSAATRQRILNEAIKIVASDGVADLTFRRLGERTGVALSTIIYHFPTKHHLNAGLFDLLCQHAFDAIGEIGPLCDGAATSYDVAVRLLQQIIDRDSVHAMAFCKVVLDFSRDECFRADIAVWNRRISNRISEATSDLANARSLHAEAIIDFLCGLAFIAIPTDLSSAALSRLAYDGDLNLLKDANGFTDEKDDDHVKHRQTDKSRQTKEKIVEACINLLVDEGVGALSYRRISQKSGLTLAAPIYHFSNIESLLVVTQLALFARSKERIRAIGPVWRRPEGYADTLADITSAVLFRESTEFAAVNRAMYEMWLEAPARPYLRASIADIILSFGRAWRDRLSSASAARNRPGLAVEMMALYTGKLIRLIATGSPTEALAGVRATISEAML